MQVVPTSGRISCSACGGLNPEIARFCNRCAAPLVGAATSAAQQAASPAVAVPSPAVPPAVPPAAPTQPLSITGAPPSAEPAKAAEPARGRKICPGCHRFNPATAAFCAECGVSLPQASTVPLFGGPAGFWIRLGAFVIDGVLLGGMLMFLGDRLGFPEVDYERLPLAEALLRDLPAIALNIGVACLYAMILIGTWGGTLGKLILGLRVVRHSDGGKVAYGLALGRSLAEYVSMIPLGLGYLWVALSPAKRAWHDYLCDTRVVHARAD